MSCEYPDKKCPNCGNDVAFSCEVNREVYLVCDFCGMTLTLPEEVE